MKSIKRLLTVMMCFTLIACTMIILPQAAFAADEEYTYTVTVNSGKEGTLN